MSGHDAPGRSPQSGLDPVTATNLRSVGLLERLMAIYIESTPPLVEDAVEAVAQGDHDRAMRAFHSLKSSSATIGLTDLSDCCGRLEIAAKRGDGAVCAREMPRFLAAYRRAVAELAGPHPAATGPARP